MTFNEISNFLDKMKMLEAMDTVVEEVEPEPYVHPLVLAMRELQAEGIVETASTGQGGGSAGNGGGQMVGGPTTYEQEYDMFKRKGPRRITAMTNEALDSSYPYEFKNNNYYFSTEAGNDYKVMFSGTKKVEVSFVTRDKTGQVKDTITGTGDARKVFGTVIEIVKEYASQHSPEIIVFSAVNDEPSRIKLYNTLATQVGKALPGYTFAKTLKNAMFTVFYLTQDNIKVPKLDTVKNTVDRALDKVFEETTTLNQLYKDGKPERNETIWDYGTMIWDDPYEIEIISPRTLDMYLCEQYNVEFLEDLFERMSKEQHEIIDKYINDPNLSNKIIVLDNGYIVDGNHRAIAAALTKRPIKYIDIGEEEITEALDSRPYKYHFDQVGDTYVATFVTANNVEYEAIIDMLGPTNFHFPADALKKGLDAAGEPIEVIFNMNDEQGNPRIGIENTGDARRVFSTVIDVVKTYTTIHKPAEIHFYAKENSRVRLYDAFVNRLDRELPEYKLADSWKKGMSGKHYVLQLKTFER